MTELTGSGAITKEYIDTLNDEALKAKLTEALESQQNTLPIDNNQEVVS